MVGQIDRNFDGMVPPMYQCGICHLLLGMVSVAIGTNQNVKNFKSFKMLQNWWNLKGLLTVKSAWDFWSWNFQNGYRCHGNWKNVNNSQIALNLMKLDIIVTWQVKMRLLTLKLSKWLPLPWKQQKCHVFKNDRNVLKIYRKMYSHANMCIHY